MTYLIREPALISKHERIAAEQVAIPLIATIVLSVFACPITHKCEIQSVMTNLPEWAVAALLFIVATGVAIVGYFLKKRDDFIDVSYTKLSDKMDSVLNKVGEIGVGTSLLTYRMAQVEQETKKLELKIENQDKVMDDMNEKLELLMKYKPLLDKLLKQDGNS